MINETCTSPYRGLLCAGCDHGFGINDSFECIKCSANATQLVIFIALLISAVLASGGLVAYTIRQSEKEDDDYKSGQNIPMYILLTALSMLQSMAFFQGFEYTWPDTVQRFFKTSQTASGGGLGFLNMQCMASSISSQIAHVYMEALVTISLMPICLCVLVIVLVVLGSTAKFYRRLNICVFHVLFLFQPVAVRGILKVMTCKQIGTSTYLFYDPAVECWSDSHVRWFVPLSLVFFLYTSFLPGLNLLALFRDRDLILAEAEEALRKWGFEINAWETEYYYWNLVIMARKVSQTTIITLSMPMGIVVQSQLTIAISIVAVIVHVKCKPYRDAILNRLEMISILTFGVTAWLGVLMSQENADYMMKAAGSIAIVVINLVAILYMLWHFVFQTRYWVEQKIEMKMRQSELVNELLESQNAQSTTGTDIELAEVNPVAMATLDQDEEDRKDLEEVGVIVDDDERMPDGDE